MTMKVNAGVLNQSLTGKQIVNLLRNKYFVSLLNIFYHAIQFIFQYLFIKRESYKF